MFDQLSQRLGDTFQRLRGRGRLTEDNISDALRDVRRALLEADVALPAVKTFIDRARERAVGQNVIASLKPAEALVKIVHGQLIETLGGDAAPLTLNRPPPVVMLMAGLQGAGKTTTTGKLARFIAEHHDKKVLVASADIYRPAAIDQLETVAAQAGAAFYRHPDTRDAVEIAKAAVAEARRRVADVLIIDTAGRLHTKFNLMAELNKIKTIIQKTVPEAPQEVVLVIDATTGQNGLVQAAKFTESADVTDIFISKLDGTAKGGIAFSVAKELGTPISYIGTGERATDMAEFKPDTYVDSLFFGEGEGF